MKQDDTKYFDTTRKRPIDFELDGCDLTQWDDLYGKAIFAHHPKGFKIFLSPQKIVACDEYVDSDPYTVEQNITSAFHRRRIELTIELTTEAISLLHKTPRILDLGCGQGHITHLLRKELPSAEYSGLDYSVSAIEYAHTHFPGIDFAVGDVYEAPYSQAYFDLVICINLWEHVPDPLHLLSKIKEMLKPCGSLILSTPSRYQAKNLARILMGKPIGLSAHHVTEYTVGQIIEQLTYGDFFVKKILSRPVPTGSLKVDLIRRIFAFYVSLIGSHHQLEDTVFYFATKKPYSENMVTV